MKKAQGMSIRIIIIAVLAIVVMLILIAIFSNKINMFSANAMNCESKGGQCLSSCSSNEIIILGTSCNFDSTPENDKCCIKEDQVVGWRDPKNYH